jgi:hypothetical protein
MAVRFFRSAGIIEMDADADEFDEKVTVDHIDIASIAAGDFTITEMATGARIGRFTANATVADRTIPVGKTVNGLKLAIGGAGAGIVSVHLKKA